MPTAIDKSERVIAAGPRSLTGDLLSGTSALGIAMVIERGLGFLANVLAARFAGSEMFGAYSVSLTTANNIASYAAGGIGSTATRFSAPLARDSAEYVTVARALVLISAVSALAAIALLYGTAGSLAHWLLRQDALAPLLRLASLCAGGAILLECCRGFLIGRRRLIAIVLLSGMVGVGMVTLMPVAAHYGPRSMIATQAGIVLTSVMVCMILARRLGMTGLGRQQRRNLGATVREIWGFGLVQLSGLILLNLAGWWLTCLVARSDNSLSQVGLFAIAHQLRNIVALAPSLLTESALALMIGSEAYGSEPGRVLEVCTFASVGVTVCFAALGIVILPWALPMTYGPSFHNGVLPATLALATAVVHMGSAPASARLTIVSIRTWGIINAIWAVLVAVSATLFVTRGGAIAGTAIYLGANFLSGILTFSYLIMRGETNFGIFLLYLLGSGGALLLAGEEILRMSVPLQQGPLTGLLVATSILTMWLLVAAGRPHNVVPRIEQIRRLFCRI